MTRAGGEICGDCKCFVPDYFIPACNGTGSHAAKRERMIGNIEVTQIRHVCRGCNTEFQTYAKPWNSDGSPALAMSRSESMKCKCGVTLRFTLIVESIQ